jgi:hypothetical protein
MILNEKHLQDSLLYSFSSEGELLKAIKELHTLLTVKREKISEYVQDERLVSAYSMLYMGTNMPKLDFVLGQLPVAIQEELRKTTLIDWGTGPGTYLWSWANFFEGNIKQMIGVDTSEVMIRQARKFLESENYQDRVSFRTEMPKVDGDVTLVIGHALNEMGVSNFCQLVSKLKPKHLIILENGTKDSFAQVLEVRGKLKNYNNLFPCNSLNTCPLVEREGDWCHQVLNLQHPDWLERWCQKAKLDRRHMPMIGHVYSQSLSNEREATTARLLRVKQETKFSFELSVCLLEGEQNIYKDFELMKKGLSKSEQKEIKKWSWGRSFRFVKEKELSSQKWRVSLK